MDTPTLDEILAELGQTHRLLTERLRAAANDEDAARLARCQAANAGMILRLLQGRRALDQAGHDVDAERDALIRATEF